MATNVVMPQLGESVVEGTLGKWFKQVGETIEQYEPIMEVVTDKVTTEVPSPAAGTILEVLVPEGATVQAGTVLARIGQPGEALAAGDASAPVADQEKAPATESVAASPETKSNGSARARLTPVVARMISEFGISQQELDTIQGTGENGRISKKDLEQYLKTRETGKPEATSSELPPWEQPGTGELFRPTEEVFGKKPSPPSVQPSPPTPLPDTSSRREPITLRSHEWRDDASPAGEGGKGDGRKADAQKGVVKPAHGEEIQPLSPVRRAIAEHMVRSKQTAPHVTTVHEADMSRVLGHFAKHQDEFTRQGVKLTYTPYFVQAVVHALKQVPLVNAQFSDQGILFKREPNIGIAVAIDEGLIVPVLKNADEKSLLGLARTVNDLASRARDRKLAPDEVTGGTFTITNYGVFGSLFGTPVINQPQSAILGVGAIQKRVVVINDAIAIRPMVYLALTFDHRLLDGAVGDTFMNKVKEFLENYAEM